MRFLEKLIEALCWLQIFFSPFFLFALGGGVLYLSTHELLWPMLLALTGLFGGIAFAEWARRTYGCSAFLGKLLNLGGKEKKN